MLTCATLFMFALFPSMANCAELKRSWEDPKPGTNEFDFYKHRQWWADRLKKDERYQGAPTRFVEFRLDHRYTTLHEAAVADDPMGIDMLLVMGTHRQYLDGFEENGQTPLQCAIDFGSHKAIEHLIKCGANVCAFNRDGSYTALTLAKAYFDAKVDTNVVPFLIMQDLAREAVCDYFEKDQKKPKIKEKVTLVPATVPVPDDKSSYKVRLRRRAPFGPQPDPERPATPEYSEYDSYLLNV